MTPSSDENLWTKLLGLGTVSAGAETCGDGGNGVGLPWGMPLGLFRGLITQLHRLYQGSGQLERSPL
jgi:hypothetical protein